MVSFTPIFADLPADPAGIGFVFSNRLFATALIACYLSFVSAATALLMLSILPICRFSLQPPIAEAALKFDPTCLQ